MFEWVLNAILNQNKLEMDDSDSLDLFLVHNLLMKTAENVVYL